ncbi:nuclear transport factor 2 family protein [uncultured Croceitalea sp.]|uniref:nuclear transport factor 2 family protein n=1 Tax=uncultured Croceitalea sp. TaxID=1798908 RepID=UPI0033061A31
MKPKSIFTALLLCTLLSCGTNQELHVVQEKNIALVKTFFNHFNDHNWSEAAELFAEDAKYKDPEMGTKIYGRSNKELVKKYSGLEEFIPNVHDSIINIYPSGNRHIIVEFLSTGTSIDGFNLELPICTIFTIENGLIVEDFTYYDNF